LMVTEETVSAAVKVPPEAKVNDQSEPLPA
jgi:hypothetical protein